MDINSLVERTPPATSPGNASTKSAASTSSSRGRDDAINPVRSSTVTTYSTPTAQLPWGPVEPAHPPPPPPPPTRVPMRHSQTQPPEYGPGMSPYSPEYAGPHYLYAQYHRQSIPDPRVPIPIPVTHVPGSNKRPAPPHPSETPAKSKKQQKWTADEDACIIDLRGDGMKWEDISKHLPGRSAISCRLRFQNYLERRSEWDEEKKNKLARLYERFKREMWQKISKDMQMPWRAAEAMHWQIGEIEMAQRANVPVFHLSGYSASQPSVRTDRPRSATPPSEKSYTHTRDNSLPQPAMSQQHYIAADRAPSTSPGMAYTHTYQHCFPQAPTDQTQHAPMTHYPSPAHTGGRRNSTALPPSDYTTRKRRADSRRSIPTASPTSGRNLLPPVGDILGPNKSPARYSLPPVGAPHMMHS